MHVYKQRETTQQPCKADTPLFLHATQKHSLRFPGGFAFTTGRTLPAKYSTHTQNFDYSRVKFVVHNFLGGNLSESDHSLLNSAGTTARTAGGRVRAPSALVSLMCHVDEHIELRANFLCRNA